jgi:hypothetical protein
MLDAPTSHFLFSSARSWLRWLIMCRQTYLVLAFGFVALMAGRAQDQSPSPSPSPERSPVPQELKPPAATPTPSLPPDLLPNGQPPTTPTPAPLPPDLLPNPSALPSGTPPSTSKGLPIPPAATPPGQNPADLLPHPVVPGAPIQLPVPTPPPKPLAEQAVRDRIRFFELQTLGRRDDTTRYYLAQANAATNIEYRRRWLQAYYKRIADYIGVHDPAFKPNATAWLAGKMAIVKQNPKLIQPTVPLYEIRVGAARQVAPPP